MRRTISGGLAAVLLTLLHLMGWPVTVFAADTDIMTLYQGGIDKNAPFVVEQMFPGDSVTKDFTIRVTHKQSLTLYYTAEIQPGSELLAEVMQMRIELPEQGVTLYDGLMRDVPDALRQPLEARENEILYRITAYLDTSVGNRYQGQSLTADFRWWYVEEAGGGGSGGGGGTADPGTPDQPTNPDVSGESPGGETEPSNPDVPGEPGRPGTGDDSHLWFYVDVCTGSAAAILLLLFTKKREREESER